MFTMVIRPERRPIQSVSNSQNSRGCKERLIRNLKHVLLYLSIMRPLKALLVTSPNNQLTAVRVNVVKRALSQTSAQIDSKYAAPIISTLTLKRRRVIHCAWRAQTGGRLPESMASGAEPASTLQGSYTARRIKMRLPSARRTLRLGISLLLLAAPTLAQNN